MSELSFLDHLLELRKRLLQTAGFILIIFSIMMFFSSDLYEIVAQPLIEKLPSNASMIATNITSPFFTPLKLAFMATLFVGIPFFLYQIWGFIAPALYHNEKRLIAPLLLSSTCLFYTGMAFAYFVVFPLIFDFFAGIYLENVTIATDIASYLDFIITLFFAFGIAFEVPVAIILICWTGASTPDALAEKRPFIIVGAFVVGMLMTPPDVISQTLLAIPVWILFELGLVIARVYKPNKKI